MKTMRISRTRFTLGNLIEAIEGEIPNEYPRYTAIIRERIPKSTPHQYILHTVGPYYSVQFLIRDILNRFGKR